jgi:DNA-binding NarL/FixJ family response regulator
MWSLSPFEASNCGVELTVADVGGGSTEIRVLIADDNPIYRHGVHGVVAAASDMLVVGEAANGQEAIDLVRSQEPDVVLLDVQLPVLDGLDVTRAIRREYPHSAVVLLASNDDEERLFEAIKVGAAAFCRKDVQPADLLASIRRVNAGEYLINESVLTRPLVASRVLKQFRDLSAVDQDVEPLFVPLSAREIEVLDYIARGNSNKEIARALKISDQTVKNHITSILRKLAVNDRTQAVVYALRKGWIKLSDDE